MRTHFWERPLSRDLRVKISIFGIKFWCIRRPLLQKALIMGFYRKANVLVDIKVVTSRFLDGYRRFLTFLLCVLILEKIK